jgi:predicted acylesterase/phospholipase RssA/CRP-like cAMP-binding protein
MFDRSASGMTIALRPGADLAEPAEIVLSEVPLFVAAGPEVIARMAERSERVRLAAGEWLFRAGDPADALYVVASGRIEAVLDDDGHSVMRTLARGDVIGELALLTGAPRSASVRARRDAELVRLAGADLAALLREQPEAALALTRALSQQLQESRTRESELTPVPSTVAIVPLHAGLPVRELRDAVVRELRRGGRVVELDGSSASGDAERGRLLDRVEPDHDQVLLIADSADPADAWTAFCLRQADRVVAVAAAGAAPPARGVPGQLRGADLAFVAGDVAATGIRAWMDALAPARRYLLHGGDGLERGAARMARRLSGRALGLVLSGGGARGSAHIGVVEELLAAGVEIDRIGGTSMGALVAGLFASGLTPDEAATAIAGEMVERNPLNDYTLPLVALTRGRKGEAMVRRLFGMRTIESLERDFFAVAADLISNEMVEFRSGLLAEAVGSSVAIPGYVPPVALGDRLLVDGGVLNNLPVDLMAADEGPVVAVNVGARAAPPPRPTRFRRPRTRKAAAAVRRFVTGVEAPRLGFGQALMRSVVLDGADPQARLSRYADVVIAPDVAGVDLLDWTSMPQMRAAGRAAARAALAEAPERLKPPG